MKLTWSKEDEKQLSELWFNSKKSAAQIATILGKTRSSVISKAHRTLGNARRAAVEREVKVKINPYMSAFETDNKVNNFDLNGCAFPYGDIKLNTFHYCNDVKQSQSPYCEKHHSLCRKKLTPKGKEDNI